MASRVVVLARLPRATARPPGWHGMSVILVLRAETAAKGIPSCLPTRVP